MRYLLDTCVLLWLLSEDRNKIAKFAPIVEDANNSIVVSVVSYWEMIIKQSHGKLTIPENVIDIVKRTGFVWLNLTGQHIQHLLCLPKLHRDPFDRILIAQAQFEQLKILTTDKQIMQYENNSSDLHCCEFS